MDKSCKVINFTQDESNLYMMKSMKSDILPQNPAMTYLTTVLYILKMTQIGVVLT